VTWQLQYWNTGVVELFGECTAGTGRYLAFVPSLASAFHKQPKLLFPAMPVVFRGNKE
jgi:hypothetical protein